MNAKHLLITTSLAAALFFVGSAAGNSYRVFYYVCGEKRERPYHGKLSVRSTQRKLIEHHTARRKARKPRRVLGSSGFSSQVLTFAE